jgi:hypothetical protein
VTTLHGPVYAQPASGYDSGGIHLVAEKETFAVRHPLPNRELSSLYLHHIRGLINFASDLQLTWYVDPRVEEVTDADAELQGEAPPEDTDEDAAPTEV